MRAVGTAIAVCKPTPVCRGQKKAAMGCLCEKAFFAWVVFYRGIGVMEARRKVSRRSSGMGRLKR